MIVIRERKIAMTKKFRYPNELIFVVGAPGSGKSTYLKEHANEYSSNYKIISRDKIRFSMLDKNDDYFNKEDAVFKEFIKQIYEALLDGYDVFVDATNLNKKSRRKTLKALLNYNSEHLENGIMLVSLSAIYFDTSLETCLYRNNKRTGREFVPKSIVKRMYFSLEKPTKEEGFDIVWKAKED